MNKEISKKTNGSGAAFINENSSGDQDKSCEK